MTTLYVRSTDGSDSDNGTTWALAKATLVGALAIAVAGDTIFVSQAHAETQASNMTLTSAGTAASPITILCGNDGAEPPTALATTATISATSTSTIAFVGFGYVYGIAFKAGSTTSNGTINANAGTPWWWKFDSCALMLIGSSNSARMNFGISGTTADDSRVELINTTLNFASTSQGVVVRCPFIWRDTASAITGTAPTTLFLTPTASNTGWARLNNVDLSALGSNNIVDAGRGNFTNYILTDCKLGTSFVFVTGTNAGQGGVTGQLINCDSGDTHVVYRQHSYQGDISEEITVVRTGGATDGTTPISRKMVSSANAKFYSPLELLQKPLYWNQTLGSITITVEVVTDNVTLTNAEAWIEVEYQGTSGFPFGLVASDRATNILTTPANQTSSAASWPSAPGTPITQKLEATFTPAEIGLIKVRVMLAKASTTMYVCPLILTSSGRQFMTGESSYINEPSTAAGGSLLRPVGMRGNLV